MCLVGAESLGPAVVERAQVERARAHRAVEGFNGRLRAAAGSDNKLASSGIEFATIGGNTDGMNVSALLASTIENAICPG